MCPRQRKKNARGVRHLDIGLISTFFSSVEAAGLAGWLSEGIDVFFGLFPSPLRETDVQWVCFNSVRCCDAYASFSRCRLFPIRKRCADKLAAALDGRALLDVVAERHSPQAVFLSDGDACDPPATLTTLLSKIARGTAMKRMLR